MKRENDCIDGIRGWASFVVLLHHLLPCYLLLTISSISIKDHISNNFVLLIIYIFTKFITNGHLAVVVFFLISGYALSAGLINNPHKLATAAISRYFRLAIPILLTCLIPYILLKMDMMFNIELANSNMGLSDWLGTFYNFKGNLNDVIIFSLYDVFFNYNKSNSYNSNLWTMSVELLGSFIVYVYIWIHSKTKKARNIVLIIAAIVFYLVAPTLSCFLWGCILLKVKNRFNNLQRFVQTKWMGELCLILLFIFCMIISVNMQGNDYFDCVLAVIIVFTISYSNIFNKLFTSRISKFMGSISFTLYLIQVPIICSWSSYLALSLPSLGFGMVSAFVINLISTVILCTFLAKILKPIDVLGIKVSKIIGLYISVNYLKLIYTKSGD